MKYDPERHHRRSIRLKGYDYSQAGAYYFTIVAQNRACLFGDVINAEMICNDAGSMFREQWNSLPERFPQIELDEFIVMPNHVHGILLITDKTNPDSRVDNAGRGVPLWSPDSAYKVPLGDDEHHDPTLGNILGAWKSIVTDEYIKGVRQKNWLPFDGKLLQRNYWEHIIRNECELDAIREYIINNPAHWVNDEHNPKRTPT